MWNYTDQVMEHFYNPRNQGLLEPPQEPSIKIATGEIGSIACGDALRLHLKIDTTTDTILDAKFQTFGCASAIASSSALTEMVKGMTLDQALNITNRDIAEFLGGLPEEKMHCSVMGQEALEAAIFNYRGIPLIEHDDDHSPLICTCFGISEDRIRRIIAENHLTQAEQVTNYIKAGGGCGTCLSHIDDLIAEVQSQTPAAVAIATNQQQEQTAISSVAVPLTNVQKIALIQQVIAEEIRPVLRADGGDVELYDVDGDRILVTLTGACGTCPSSTLTLKIAIEARLQDRVSPNLRVEAI